MARSRAKQGNRKNRVRVKNPDGSLMKDSRGRPITVGVKRYEPDKWELIERAEKRAAFWKNVHAKRDAERALAQEAAGEAMVGM